MDTFKEREIFWTSGAWEKLDANTDLAVWKQENNFAPGFQNFKIILPRLACMEAILTSFHGSVSAEASRKIFHVCQAKLPFIFSEMKNIRVWTELL